MKEAMEEDSKTMREIILWDKVKTVYIKCTSILPLFSYHPINPRLKSRRSTGMSGVQCALALTQCFGSVEMNRQHHIHVSILYAPQHVL